MLTKREINIIENALIDAREFLIEWRASKIEMGLAHVSQDEEIQELKVLIRKVNGLD